MRFRAAALWLTVILLLGCAAIAAGLRYNGSRSFPVGLYLASHKRAVKGDLVFVAPPAIPILELAKARGYLDVAYSPAAHLMKRVAAAAGDRVTINLAGVHVNGIRLANSAPLPCDGAGRALKPYAIMDYVLGPNEVLLMSDYNPASFDSRYFGPLDARTIESVVTPVLTW
jgi:conjugative transfer signal peptidase TraF